MASKAANGKEKLMDEEDEVLQAVILADSFDKQFRPLTTHKPRCLLPICNAPLLDWTFESPRACRRTRDFRDITFSAGDAMRDVYTRGLVTSDFVLVMGDLVSNIRIDEVVRVHKEQSGATHRTRAQGDSSVFVLDAETSECLHYEHAHPEIDIRNDLIDCSIDVCSVEVPSLFQDNFDYEDIRRDFLRESGYAARVKDTKSYESVSKDILSRWTFPLVPDDNHPGGHLYQHTRGNTYIAADKSVVLARCDPPREYQKMLQIIGSVIGSNCVIGAGTVIDGSYIFDGTVIGAQCVVKRSIIGAGVTIKEKTRIEKGCLVGDGVVIGPLAVLDPFERLSKRRDKTTSAEEEDEDDDDSDLDEIEANQEASSSMLGKDSNAVVWPQGPSEEDDDEDGIANYKNYRVRRLDSSDGESESSGYDSPGDFHMSSDSGTSQPVASLDVLLPSGTMQESEFHAEVVQSLERAFAEGHSVDNAAVELKTLRMASNVPLSRVREAVVAAIVDKIRIVEGRVIGRWGELIDKIGGVNAVETVSALQDHCASSERMPLFGQILAELYQTDIVDEDDIRAWYALPAAKGVGLAPGPTTDNVKRCWAVGSRMIQQFDEQESDDEESDDEESE
ncbi:nucleotide-diphospho-sugar transferase [Mycena rebaudengoi]|nr:nucleotide-diphospho-sugar transferase [Mycena rebaudengoi]